MREGRRLHPEALVKRHVLARVGPMVFAPDDVRDLHRDVVDDVHQVKHRIAVRAHDHEILVLDALHAAADLVLNHDGRRLDLGHGLLAVLVKYLVALAEQLEPDRPVLLVGPARRQKFADIFLVDVAALALPIRAVVTAPARAILGTLVPIHPEPREALIDQLEELLAVALLVRVLDAQNEHAAGVARVEPVEQRRAGAADVKETRGTGSEANADLGHN